MKKLISLAVATCMVLGTTSVVLADTVDATVSNASISIDGTNVELGAYTINGYTYFKLRDVAAALVNTDANFAVDYDKDAKAITLSTDVVADELDGTSTESVVLADAKAEVSVQKILLDGAEISLEAYNISGYNYFQLRELGEFLDFDVAWDNEAKIINLSTTSIVAEAETEVVAEIEAEEPADAVLTTADLQQLFDDADSNIITLEGNFQGEGSDSISITSGCTITSETGALLTNIAFVVDTEETVSISNISFDGVGSESASLQLLSVGDNSLVENCSFANYAHEAILIEQILTTGSLTIQQCEFLEYGLAEGGIDSAILAQNDDVFAVLLKIQDNTFQVTRADSDMNKEDMDVAFMTASNSDENIVFGQLNLYFIGNTITKGSKTFSTDICAVYKESASQLS